MFVICCIRSFMLHARVIYSCVRAFVRDLILKTTAAVATTAVAATAVTTAATAIIVSNIAGTEVAAAPTSSTTATTAPTTVTGHLVKPSGDLLVVFFKHFSKFSNDARVFLVNKGQCASGVSGTSGTTNTMDIVINVGGEIEVDDLSNIRNIQTTTGYVSGAHYWSVSTPERAKGFFTFPLGLISMNGTSREPSTAENVFTIIA